jgi:hypothetical protein
MKGAYVSALAPLRSPTTGIAGCCARAASGHAVAPPSRLMNSRRLNCIPQFLARCLHFYNNELSRVGQQHAAVRDFDPGYVSNGSKPEVTAPQQQRPVRLEQRTLRIAFSTGEHPSRGGE